MYLRIARSERRGWISQKAYSLTVRFDASLADCRIIDAHGLMPRLVYIDPTATALALQAQATFERARKLSPLRRGQRGKRSWAMAKTLLLTIRSQSCLAVTLADLLRGTTISSPNIDDILEAEATLLQAFDRLKTIIDNATAFSNRNEKIFEPEGADDADLFPPAVWPKHAGR